MASIDKREDGTYRARWREYPGGPQKTRQFARTVGVRPSRPRPTSASTPTPPSAGARSGASSGARSRPG
jgi:hypothetical protein